MVGDVFWGLIELKSKYAPRKRGKRENNKVILIFDKKRKATLE